MSDDDVIAQIMAALGRIETGIDSLLGNLETMVTRIETNIDRIGTNFDRIETDFDRIETDIAVICRLRTAARLGAAESFSSKRNTEDVFSG